MSPYIPRDPVRRDDRILARGVFCILLALFSLTFNGMPEEPRGDGTATQADLEALGIVPADGGDPEP